MAVGPNQRLDRALSGYRATIGKNEFDPWDASGERAAEYASRYGGSPSLMAHLADQQSAVEQAGNEQALRWQAQQDRGGFAGGVRRALPYAAMLGATAATGGLAGPTWLAALRAAPAAFGGLGAVTGNKTMRNIGTVAGLANLGYGLYGGGAGAASQTAAGAATDTAGQAVGDIAMNGNRTTMGNLFQPGGNTVRSWAERFPLSGATNLSRPTAWKPPQRDWLSGMSGTIADLAKGGGEGVTPARGNWRSFLSKAWKGLDAASKNPAATALISGGFDWLGNRGQLKAEIQGLNQGMALLVAQEEQNEFLRKEQLARLRGTLEAGISAGKQLEKGMRGKYYDKDDVTDEGFRDAPTMAEALKKANETMSATNLRIK
jgi:hypothetical protein